MCRPPTSFSSADLDEDWRALGDHIEVLSAEIEGLSQNDAACQRMMTVPDIGPIISSAVVAAIGSCAGLLPEPEA